VEFVGTIHGSVRGLAAAYATTPPVASWPTAEQVGQGRSALVAEWSGTLLATHDGRLHVVGFGAVVRVAADSVEIYVRDLTEPTVVLRDARWFAARVCGRLAGILSEDPAGVGLCGTAAELFVDGTHARFVADPGHAPPRGLGRAAPLARGGAAMDTLGIHRCKDYEHFVVADPELDEAHLARGIALLDASADYRIAAARLARVLDEETVVLASQEGIACLPPAFLAGVCSTAAALPLLHFALPLTLAQAGGGPGASALGTTALDGSRRLCWRGVLLPPPPSPSTTPPPSPPLVARMPDGSRRRCWRGVLQPPPLSLDHTAALAAARGPHARRLEAALLAWRAAAAAALATNHAAALAAARGALARRLEAAMLVWRAAAAAALAIDHAAALAAAYGPHARRLEAALLAWRAAAAAALAIDHAAALAAARGALARRLEAALLAWRAAAAAALA
jgi:hypothetical protein